MTQVEVLMHIRKALQIIGQTFADEQALSVKGIYPQWKELCDSGFTAKEAGFRFLNGDDLYKTKTANYTFMPHWVPGVGTESIFERIDEGHAGSISDPIPYEGNMELFAGLYYTQNGVLYKCIRATGTAVYHELSALVGVYVEVADVGDLGSE